MGRWQGYIGHVLFSADKGTHPCLYIVCLLLIKAENNYKSAHYILKYLNLRMNTLSKLIILFNFIYSLQKINFPIKQNERSDCPKYESDTICWFFLLFICS